MKTSLTILTFISLLIIGSCTTTSTVDTYQVKIYTLDSLNQEAQMDQYLQEAYLPALHRAGIESVGVFKTIDGKNEGKHLVMVFIPFTSLTQFEELPAILEKDEEYAVAGKDYFDAAPENAPYMRIESILLKAFSESPNFHIPNMQGPKSERVYEFRSYQSATEKLHLRKVEMFNSGESELFVELGFEPIFFAQVISGSQMPNLIYLTCHENEEAQVANWKAFGEHPTWIEMKGMEKYKKTVSHIDKLLLYPAEYSDL